jgi:hypothetical protein
MSVRQILIFVFALPLFGCGDLGWFSTQMDPKTEPTYQFWASLQGIHYKDFPAISAKLEEAKAAIQKNDVDRTAELLHEVSEKHESLAEQLSRLGHENVDGEALAFRDQLVRSHRSLAEASKNYGTATKERDSEVIQKGQSEFVKLYEDYADLWESSTELMQSLRVKYGKDFNFQQ